ncbi:MAG: DUF4145 domain-containing protein [Desulfobulbaceae bacterium]|nr:DUF4145 domain-containing protein [Desulfobulbaceae bacterium]
MSQFHDVFKLKLAPLVNIYVSSTSIAFQHQIVELIEEAKRTFNAQCIRSTIVLAAEILHRLNCELITHIMIKEGLVRHTKSSGRNVVLRKEDTYGKDIAEELNLNETIEYLFNRQSINEDTRMIMHLIRYLRNEAIHGNVPGMLSQDPRRNTPLTLEEAKDLISGKKPLPPREYFLKFPYKGNNVKYMIYQTTLDIDLDGMEDCEMRLPAVYFRLLLLCMEQIAPSFG